MGHTYIKMCLLFIPNSNLTGRPVFCLLDLAKENFHMKMKSRESKLACPKKEMVFFMALSVLQ